MEPNLHSVENARQLLQDVFGFDDFLEGQEAVVSRLLEGKSVVAIFPTGAGKSLCFQLPAIMLDGLTLVISPLIALMKDQLDFLHECETPAARLDSSLDRDETLKVYDEINSGRLKLLYVSPERLNNERFLKSLGRMPISLLAVDEAHCISEWGHNFRPDYLKLSRLARNLRVGRVLALTATATPKVSDDIAAGFDVEPDDVINTGFYRPNLKLGVTPCRVAERGALLLSRLAKRPPGSTIVYVTLQRTAEQVAQRLLDQGYEARAYHAGMDSEKRNNIQDAFMASDRMIIVATIAFGMGIDKSDIRYIYHYNLPKGLESYSQEIGRAGRDHQTSVCEMLACANDVVVLENFSYGDTPTALSVRGLLADVLGRGDVFDVSTYTLSGKYDIRPLVVRTLLTYLEMEEVIESTGPFYSGFQFQPQGTSEQIFARFDTERADFLRSIFRHARRAKVWFSLDVDDVAKTLGQSRDRIVAALGFLEESGDLILKASGLREGFRMINRPDDLEPLADLMSRRFETREKNDIERVRRVVEYAEEPNCLTRHLLAYFGESHDLCDHCYPCQGVASQSLTPPESLEWNESDIEAIRQLVDEAHDALAEPRQIARFLCGLSSPATTRAKLRKHALFGRFESMPFHDVLDQIDRRTDIR